MMSSYSDREILCDERLKKLFKKDKVNCFTMNKYLTSHMKRYDVEGEEKDETKRLERTVVKKEKGTSKKPSKSSKKVKRKVNSKKLEKLRNLQTVEGKGFHKKLKLSLELSSLLEAKELSRPQVSRHLTINIIVTLAY